MPSGCSLSRWRGQSAAFLAAALTFSLFPESVAFAASPGDTDASAFVNYEAPETERRGGFVMGFALGGGLSNFTGTPNAVASFDNPADLASTGSTFGSGVSVWMGGAPRDWLSVSLGISFASAQGDGNVAGGFSPFLRIESYPLYSLGGTFRDIGLSLDGGLSTTQIFAEADRDVSIAEGSSMAYIAATAFWEPWRFWHFSAGPGLTYAHAFSQSLTSNQLLINFRMSFYGDLPKEKPKKPETARGFVHSQAQ